MASNVPAEQAAEQDQAGTGQGAPYRVALMRRADKKRQQAPCASSEKSTLKRRGVSEETVQPHNQD